MFITRSLHGRNALGERSGLGRFCGVDDIGLGITVVQTTRFDPTLMKQKYIYWLDTAVNEMAKEAREQIKGAGGKVNEAEGKKAEFRSMAINSIPFNDMSTRIVSSVAKWDTSINVPKTPSALKTYGIMAAKMIASRFIPIIGWYSMVETVVGFFKKPKIEIPWNVIYGHAMTFARDTTVIEESNRIAAEAQRTEQQRVQAVEKISQEGARFKLPEHVKGIRSGALVMTLKSAQGQVTPTPITK